MNKKDADISKLKKFIAMLIRIIIKTISFIDQFIDDSEEYNLFLHTYPW